MLPASVGRLTAQSLLEAEKVTLKNTINSEFRTLTAPVARTH